MFELIGPIFSVAILVLFVWANVNAASRKGFHVGAWVLAAGPLGYVILVLLPSARKAGLSRRQIERRSLVGNALGLIVSGAAVLLTALLFLSAPA